jgi:prepilin-type N-terminal cleavage/methylation domain-containing protein
LHIGGRPGPARFRLAVAPARRGMTLIELVMVVSLLVLLAAIAIPSVQMAVEGRRVREAARAVNVYLGSARNRAMTTGRPVGVVLKRFENEGNVCFTLDQVETPPPYAGSTLLSRAQVRLLSASSGEAQFVTSDATPAPDPLPPGVVHVGDRIRFNHQGHWYEITGPDAGDGTLPDNTSTVQLARPAPVLPWPTTGDWSESMPYEIQRQPGMPGATGFHAAVAKPLQLPLDAVIDLTFSGGAGGIARAAFAGGTTPVVIMFSPNGGLGRLYYTGGSVLITEPLYLLIGKRERIPADIAEDGLSNLQDFENLWISISPRTGLVNTAPMGSVDVGPPTDGDITVSDPIYWARRYARLIDIMGGR